MKKFKLLWEFYKSTLAINLFPIIISFLFVPETIFINLCFFGFLISYLFKQFYRKHEYYFYFNNNISIINLYTFNLSINLLIATLVYFLLI